MRSWLSHQSTVVVDGSGALPGHDLPRPLVSGIPAEEDVPLRPAGCEADHQRSMLYAGGLALLSATATTGAVFGRRPGQPEPEMTGSAGR